MRIWCLRALLAAAVSLPGCQSGPLDQSESIAVSAVEARLQELQGQPPFRRANVTQSGPPTPTGPLSLREAMALAVAHSPRLEAYALDVRVAEARALQAGLWSNPELEAEIEGFAGSGELREMNAAETTVGLAQTFPLGGDIRRRKELAGLQTRLADWDYESARLEVLLGVTREFVAVLAAERQSALAQQALELTRATARVTERRVKAGDVSPVEQTRAEVPVVLAEVEVRRAERGRDAAYRRLALNWGSPRADSVEVQGDLSEIQPLPDVDALVALINENPLVARWATEVSTRIAERRLAQAEAVPDLTGLVGVKHAGESGDVGLVVGISLPLPVFDRRQGDVLAARLGERSAGNRKREAELRIERILSAAYADLAAAHDQAVAIRERGLPAARRALEATRRAFEEGELPLLDVIDAQRTLFELERQYLSALVAYHDAAATIESLIGQRLGTLIPYPNQENQDE